MKPVAQTKPIKLDFNEGVDRKQLKAIVARFLQLNQLRLERTHASITLRQQQILDLMPLLFHVNHPLLPGYISRECPYRIANYVPEPEAMAAAMRYSKTFKYHDEPRHQADITGLFLMGSTGSIAHSGASDFDVWLCYRENMNAQGLRALTEKSLKISAWAEELGLELHFFPMSARAFREDRQNSELDAEDCGTALHFLLLDEFYRSSIRLAGCYPLWWLIPVELEKSYTEWAAWLQDQRFIKREDYIDFGDMLRIPRGEFIGSGIWQLYKGIDAPYKSVLKLMLNEVYAQELPQQPNMSLEFKAAVYLGIDDPNTVDPYIMIYRRLERYLMGRDEAQRLLLVRKSFYLKVGIKLTSRAAERKTNWRHQVMDAMVADWGWSGKELKYLDGRIHWRVGQVLVERKAVINELTHCYRFLSQYARQHNLKATINPEDMNLLGRKLYAAFQRKAGKIEFINPNIAPVMLEESLAFHHASTQSFGAEAKGWLLYRELDNANDAPFHPVTRRSSGLLELVVWCYYNGLLGRSTRMGLLPGSTEVTLDELRNIVDSLHSLLALPLAPLLQDAYKEQSYITQTAIYINIGVDPMAALSARGMHKISSRSDSLGYSAMKENLVLTLDQVTRNSWNELMVSRYELGDTLIQCLKNTLAQIASLPAGKPLPVIDVRCFCQSRATAIAARVDVLFKNVIAAFFGRKGSIESRYVIELDSRYFVIHFSDGSPGFTGFNSLEALLGYLGAPQKNYSQIILDPYALKEFPWLKLILAQAREDVIQVFFKIREDTAEVFVLDERGAICSYVSHYYDTHSLLLPLWRFLQSVKERRQIRAQADTDWLDMDILFFLIKVEPSGAVGLHSASVGDVSEPPNYFEVQVIGSRDYSFENQADIDLRADSLGAGASGGVAAGLDDSLTFDIFCDQQEFTAMEYGDQLISAVAHFIVSRRQGAQLYPCYVTDVGLPQDITTIDYQMNIQTVQYLRYKLSLEAQLNQAIASYDGKRKR